MQLDHGNRLQRPSLCSHHYNTQKYKKAEPPVSLKKRKGGTSDKTLLDYQEDAAIAEDIAAVEAASKAVIIVYARRCRRHYPSSTPHEAFRPTPLRWIGRGRPPKQANTIDVEATVHCHNKAQEESRRRVLVVG